MRKTNLYFKSLLDLLQQMYNVSAHEKNRIWINKYSVLLQPIKKKRVEDLPLIMPLIHQDFLFDSENKCIRKIIGYTKTSHFSSNITMNDNCKIHQIDRYGDSCIFNDYPDIRKKCHADHFWPYSLGGPSKQENRLLLCEYHNGSKSNSILDVFWERYPIWLNSYLEEIYNLKLS